MGLHGNNIIAGKMMHSAPDRGAHFTARGHLATLEEATEAHVNMAFEAADAAFREMRQISAERVEVCASMQHGGPYAATTDSKMTSVGTAAILRFARPVAYQNFPQSTLPGELQNANPRGIWRLVDGQPIREPLQ